MGLFDTELTKDQIKAIEKKRLQGLGADLLQSIIGTCTVMFNSLWNNPQGLTPQEVSDAFGTDAGPYWSAFKSLADEANLIEPNSIDLTNPTTITINKDGTVTIGELPQ